MGKPYRTFRDILKVDLLATRVSYSPGRHLPTCPICNMLIVNAPDMHEALISKGQVNGHKEQDLINSRYNCVLRHNVCPDGKHSHTGGIGGDETFEKCARHLVKWEGEDKIRMWLFKMIDHFPQVALEAFYRFNMYFPVEIKTVLSFQGEEYELKKVNDDQLNNE